MISIVRGEKGTGTFCAKHPKGRSGKRCLSPFPGLAAALAASVLAGLAATTRAEDWPMYGHDAARSQITAEPVRPPLAPRWTFKARYAPTPAWGPPKSTPVEGFQELRRVHFDDALQLAVADGRVLFGSSADNKVYCLDAASGRTCWTRFTGGPIRLAPTVADARVYVGSDDGYVYCLDAADGALLWQFHAAPEDHRVLGHGRMISLWPVRTGVLVDRQVAYFGAGIFPSEGVFLYAVDARSGREIWRNDSGGETPQSGVSPQGYLLASPTTLYAPMGRVSPAGYDRANGRLKGAPYFGKSVGGTYALLAGERLYTGTEEILSVGPGARGDRFVILDGKRLVVTPEAAYVATGARLTAIDRTTYPAASCKVYAMRGRLSALNDALAGLKQDRTKLVKDIAQLTQESSAPAGAGSGGSDVEKVGLELAAKQRSLQAAEARIDQQQQRIAALSDEFKTARTALGVHYLWDVPCPCDQALIRTGDVLWVGGADRVLAFDRASGRRLWSTTVEGSAKGLAAAAGKLWVSTDRGLIYCFGPQASAEISSSLALRESARGSGVEASHDSSPHPGPLPEGEGGSGNGKRNSASPHPGPLPEGEGGSADGQRDASTDRRFQRAAEFILSASGVRRGYALVLGCETGQLAIELAKRSDLMIYAVSPDAKKVAAARRAIDAAGLYGGRICVDQWPLDRVPYADYFANLIVSETALLGGDLPPDPAEMFRMLKPVGGVAIIGRGAEFSPLSLRESASTMPRVGVRGSGIGSSIGSSPHPSPLPEGEGSKISSHPNPLPEGEGTRISPKPLPEGEGIETGPWLARSKLEGQWIGADRSWVKIVRGALPGAGSWTHLYGNPSNTACGDDERVKCPLGVLWFGQPGPGQMVSRHVRSVAPLSIDGRLFCQGENVLMAYDAYNGLKLWERALPGAMRTGVSNDCGNLAVDHQSLFVAIRDHCLRLDPASGATSAAYDLPAAPGESHARWGYVGLAGELLIGSRSELLQPARTANSASCLFAVDPQSGKRAWTRDAAHAPHTSITIGDGRIFFLEDANDAERRQVIEARRDLDAPQSPEVPAAAARRARKTEVRTAVALDARTGRVCWRVPLDVTGSSGGSLGTMYQHGVLVIFGVYTDGHYWKQFFAGDFASRRATVLAADDGRLLWSKPVGYRVRPLIIGDTLHAEPWAFNLKTGEPRTRVSPITGQSDPWQFARPGHHCGCPNASSNCLFFRSWCLGYYDLLGDYGTMHFAGQRPGCWINFIPAAGLLLMPEASAGCMCAFPNMCSVALEPTGKTKGFSYYSSAGAATPVRRLAIHLGAPGDHADAAGQLWLGYPRPRGPLIMPLNLEVSFCPGGGYVTGNSTYSATAGTADAWLFAAAAKGLTRLVVRLLEPDDGASLYRVRLAMADPDNQTPGRRVFDVKLQGRRVRSRCDIAGETGGANRALMAEFSGVEVTDKLVVELVPAMAGRLAPEQMPILQGIEVVRERVVRLGCSVPRFEVNTAHPRQTARLQLTNLRDEAFRGRLEIAAAEGFALSPRQAAVELPSGGRQAIELELVASPSARPGTWPITVRLARADGSLELEQAGTVEHLGRHARQVIPASEDTYAMQRYPDLNKGTATVLMVDGGDQVMGDVDHSVAYLKFPLPATDRVISARLRLTNAGNPSFDAGRVCLVNQPWRETELTYVNRPAPGQELARIGRVEAYQVVEIPLRVDLAGKRELSLAIDPTSLDGVDFVSREGGKPPELIVEYQQE